jgi:hypothetical protein
MTVQNVSINAERAKRILIKNMGYIIQNAANIFHIAAFVMRLIFSRPPIFKIKNDSWNLVYRYHKIPRWNRGKRKLCNRGAKILQACTNPIQILIAF